MFERICMRDVFLSWGFVIIWLRLAIFLECSLGGGVAWFRWHQERFVSRDTLTLTVDGWKMKFPSVMLSVRCYVIFCEGMCFFTLFKSWAYNNPETIPLNQLKIFKHQQGKLLVIFSGLKSAPIFFSFQPNKSTTCRWKKGKYFWGATPLIGKK